MSWLRKKRYQPVRDRRRHADSSQGTGQVSSRSYSYRSNRLRSDQKTVRHQDTIKISRRSKWQLLPSYMALLAIVFCGLYIVTLDSSVRVRARTEGNGISADQQSAKLSEYEAYVSTALQENLLSRTKITVDTEELERSLLDRFPEILGVSVVVPLVSRGLIVEVVPAVAVLTLESQRNLYGIDETGRAFITYDRRKPGIPLVGETSDIDIVLGDRVLPAQTVRFIQQLTFQMENNDFDVQKLALPAIANEIHLTLRGEKYVGKFDIARDAREQAGTFVAVKEQLTADNIMPKEYIDVRVRERAFYK